MKYQTVLFTFATVMTAVSADPWRRVCGRFRMPCGEIIKARDLTSTILNEPVDTTSAQARACFGTGKPCDKAKRAEEALRGALANADIANYDDGKGPASQFCTKGNPCPKSFKHVEKLGYTETERRDDTSADHSFCHSPGQQCDKVKRAAEALAAAAAHPGRAVVKRSIQDNRCSKPGAPCGEALETQCWRKNGECSKAKRALDDLTEAAIDAHDYVTEDLPGSHYNDY